MCISVPEIKIPMRYIESQRPGRYSGPDGNHPQSRKTINRLMRATLLGAGLVLTLQPLPSSPQTGGPTVTHRVHMHSKPAVVKIYAGFRGKFSIGGRVYEELYYGHGSGFIINPDGYILTNAHVVSRLREQDDKARELLLRSFAARLLRERQLPVNESNLRKFIGLLLKEGMRLLEFSRINFVFLQSGTRYPFDIKSYGTLAGRGKDLISGKDVAVIKIEVKNAPTLRLANSDDVQVGDRMYAIGYPGAIESPVHVDQKSMLEPTTNDGLISAKRTMPDGTPILQTNTNISGGNSGGPAINEKGEVIGLMTWGARTQGFNFMVPTNTAMEFVRQAGAELKQGPVDQRWQEGLEHYWKGQYTKAREKLTQVIALHAEHAVARQLLGETEQRIAKGEDRSGFEYNQWIGIVLLGSGAVGLLAIVVVAVRRRAGKPAQAAVFRGASIVEMPAQKHAATGEDATAMYMRNAPSGSGDATLVYTNSDGGKLECTEGPLRGKVFSVGGGTFIGRDPKRAQIVIQDTEVSGQHVWVGVRGDKVIARDCGSTNGTFLNGNMGQRITEVTLSEGDVLTLGGRGAVRLAYRK